jgi:hypothetical protein
VTSLRGMFVNILFARISWCDYIRIFIQFYSYPDVNLFDSDHMWAKLGYFTLPCSFLGVFTA